MIDMIENGVEFDNFTIELYYYYNNHIIIPCLSVVRTCPGPMNEVQ